MNKDDSVSSVERKMIKRILNNPLVGPVRWVGFSTSDKIAFNGPRKKHSLPKKAFSSVKVSPKERTSLRLSQSPAA